MRRPDLPGNSQRARRLPAALLGSACGGLCAVALIVYPQMGLSSKVQRIGETKIRAPRRSPDSSQKDNQSESRHSSPMDQRRRSQIAAFDGFKKKLAAHFSAARDPSWSNDKERAIIAQLTAHALAHPDEALQVLRADCRTTTCTALLRWPNAAHARRSAQGVTTLLNPGCATEIFLDPILAETDHLRGNPMPVESNLLLTCTRTD
jgi:hypothetical protein